MLQKCAPNAHLRVTTHSILVTLPGRVAELPKGPGVPRRARPRELGRAETHMRALRAVVRVLKLDPGCVRQFFPELA